MTVDNPRRAQSGWYVFRACMLLLAVSVAVISALYYDLQFFTDSQTYVSRGYTASNSIVHRWILKYAPGYQLISFFLVTSCLWYLLKTYRNTLILVVVFHPYSLLLLFNGTKEQLVFLGFMSLYFARQYHLPIVARIFLLTVGLLFSSIRGFYLPIALMPFVPLALRVFRIRPSSAMFFTASLGVLTIIAEWNNILYYYEWLQNRSNWQHVGRDYFPGLCITEKADILAFSACWLGAYLGMPIHDDLLSFNYAIHMSILVATYAALGTVFVRKGYISKVYFCYALLLCFLFFWWGPVLGAAQRYFWPVLWGVILILQTNNRVPLVFKIPKLFLTHR